MNRPASPTMKVPAPLENHQGKAGTGYLMTTARIFGLWIGLCLALGLLIAVIEYFN